MNESMFSSMTKKGRWFWTLPFSACHTLTVLLTPRHFFFESRSFVFSSIWSSKDAYRLPNRGVSSTSKYDHDKGIEFAKARLISNQLVERWRNLGTKATPRWYSAGERKQPNRSALRNKRRRTRSFRKVGTCPCTGWGNQRRKDRKVSHPEFSKSRNYSYYQTAVNSACAKTLLKLQVKVNVSMFLFILQ